MRKLSLIFLFVGVINASFAQTERVDIKGVVMDAETKKALEFANITLLSDKDSLLIKGGLTDTLGGFNLFNIDTGSYILVASALGYTPQSRKIVVSGKDVMLDVGEIFLPGETKLLDEVQVTAQKPAFLPTAEGVTINVNNSLFKTSTNVIDVLKKSSQIDVDQNGGILLRRGIAPKILINGRDVPMSADELKNYLNTLNPDQVEDIEIIANASAKYDAEYKGVINIQLKRDKELGFTGNASTTFQKHRQSSSMNSLNLTYKTKKMAYSTRGNYANTAYFEESKNEQKLGNGDILLTNLFAPSRNRNLDFIFGVDHFISKKASIGGQVKYFQNKLKIPITYDIAQNNADKVLRNIITTNDLLTKNNNYSGNVYFEGQIKGGHVSITSSLVRYQHAQNQYIENRENETSNFLRGNFANSSNIKAVQLDFVPKLKGGKLELGSKFSHTGIDNDTQYENLITNAWTIDQGNSNIFLYKERTVAAYITYSHKWKKLAYMIGMRTESTNTEGNSITLNTITKQSYSKWLPSINLNMPFNKNNNLSFSYSKRLTRPSFTALNPFIYIGGPFTTYGGNQYLIPVTNNAFNISYYFKEMSIATNFGINYNDIQQVPRYDPISNKTSHIYQNLTSNRYGGIEIGVPINITKWWKMQNNLSLYANYYVVAINGESVKTRIDYAALNTSQNIELGKAYNLSISGEWRKGGGTALFGASSLATAAIGLEKTFFKKLKTVLKVNDIFYSYIFIAESIRPDIIELKDTHKFSTRYLSLQLNYTFGKSTYSNKNGKNSSEEEENRARR